MAHPEVRSGTYHLCSENKKTEKEKCKKPSPSIPVSPRRNMCRTFRAFLYFHMPAQ